MVKKVIVLGLDGASLSVLMPLIEKDKLPAFKKLLKMSSYGPLKSTMPPISIPAWKCYSTGRDPGKLGVYNLLMLDMKNRKLSAPGSGSFKSPEIWDYVGDAGLKSCVYNMFGTYPAKKISGCLISDVPSAKGFYPPELKTEIESRFGVLNPDTNFVNDRDGSYQKALRGIKNDFEIAKYLMEKYNPDFTHFSISYTDGIQHFFWGDMERNDPATGKNIELAWVEIDNLLADFRRFLDEKYAGNYYLLIMSDHGFENVEYRFNIGEWLINKGFLKLNKKGKSLRQTMFLRDRLQIIYPLMEFITNLTRSMTRSGTERKGTQEMLLASSVYEKSIDWKESKVIPLAGECLYINPEKVSSDPDFVSNLIKEISQIKKPDGKLMAREAINGKLFYQSKSAPDVLILPENTEVYNAPLLKTMWSKPVPSRWTGRHALYGTMIIYGPDIKKDHRIDGTTLYDLAPTILNMLGLPVPEDMDGSIIRDAFAPSAANHTTGENKS